MNENINLLNKRFNSIESLFTKNGNINSSILRRKYFKQLNIYKFIIDNTTQLNIFKEIKFKERLIFLKDKMQISYCKKCNQPYILFKKSQNSYKLCNHREVSENGKQKLKNKYKTYQLQLKQLIQDNKNLILSNKNFNNILNDLILKNKNYTFSSCNTKFFNFYHDLVIRTSNILKFNFNHNLNLSERFYIFINKIKEIPKCKYCGKESYFKNRIKGYSQSCIECRNKKLDDTIFEKNKSIIDNNIDIKKYEIIEYPLVLNKNPLIIKCKKCQCISSYMLNNGKIQILNPNSKLCKNCENINSKFEEELYNYLYNKLNIKNIIHKKDSRKIIFPQELDIYIPNHKLAIECNGLYWHSNDKLPKNYHLEKTEKCNEKNIQLIHIFEDEYEFKNEIIKSRIKNLLGIYDNIIFARKCQIREITNKESRDFQDKNHLQGAINSKVNIGLFYQNKLISIITFGKCRFDKKHEWEMLRFCNKLGYHIPGGASKLLKYFEKTYKPKSLVSYADRRWSQGKLYEKLGFKLDHISQPNYWYIKNNSRLNRQNFQKHKLKNILKVFDENKSEVQNMKDNGYYRIFDCGNLVFEKIYE